MKSRVGCCIRVFSLDMGLLGCGIALLSGIGYGRFFLLCFEYRDGGWILSFLYLVGYSSSFLFGITAPLVDSQSLGTWLRIHVLVLLVRDLDSPSLWVRVGLAGRT